MVCLAHAFVWKKRVVVGECEYNQYVDKFYNFKHESHSHITESMKNNVSLTNTIDVSFSSSVNDPKILFDICIWKHMFEVS